MPWDTLIPSSKTLPERRLRPETAEPGCPGSASSELPVLSLLRAFDGLRKLRRGGLGIHLAVEVGGDHVVGRVLHRGRRGMAMGHRAEQGAVLAGFGQILHALLAAGIEVLAVNISAGGNRALHLVEGDLERGRHDRARQLLLGGAAVLADLEHDELVGVEVAAALVPGKAKQRKALPGTFPAVRDPPLAQSPMNCTPALPSITMAEARFQSRPEKLSSR